MKKEELKKLDFKQLVKHYFSLKDQSVGKQTGGMAFITGYELLQVETVIKEKLNS